MKRLYLTKERTEWLYAPDLVYYDDGSCQRHVSLIFPYQKEWREDKRFPLIVFIPGSAWLKQEMYNSVPQYARLAERGYVVAVMQYRESTIAKFPAQIEDVSRAVAYLSTLAERFHFDGNQLFLAGNSSGGHVAMMAALWNAHHLCEPFARPRGVMVESGATDLLLCAQDGFPRWRSRGPCAQLLGVPTVEGYEQLAREASCTPYITADADIPPVLLIHGNGDEVVNVENSRRLERKLKACGKKVTYYEIEGAGHGGAVFWQKEVLDRIDAFCRQNIAEVIP